MKNLLSTKKTSSIFLAVVLVLGTFTVASPSFILGNVQAQRDYGMDSYYKDPYRNSYEPDYGMDSYDKKPYRDSYGQDYPSYKPEYQKDPYGKDRDNDKSKDNISVDINKLKCINTNININGNNTGNIILGNKGKAGAEEGGYVGAYSSGSGSEGYNDGYDKKKDKDFECIINNNNTNTNTNIGAGGNQTTPPTPPDPTKTTLTVIKNVVCNDPLGTQCPGLTFQSSDFNIKVDGAGDSTETKPGAPAPGTPYQLNAGSYTITETPPTPNPSFTLSTSFSGGAAGCLVGANPQTATGTIVAGVDQSCIITNTYTPIGGGGP